MKVLINSWIRLTKTNGRGSELRRQTSGANEHEKGKIKNEEEGRVIQSWAVKAFGNIHKG